MSPGFLLGTNEIEQPVHLSELARSMHTQVIGATGVGKTESALMPIILADLYLGHSVIFIDPKGDHSTFQLLSEMCERTNRTSDLFKIDLSNPNDSIKYNPLKIGSPTELKDKIVGSIIWTEEYYKKIAEKALLCSFNLFKKCQTPSTLSTLLSFLNKPENYDSRVKGPNLNIKEEISIASSNINSHRKDLAGIISDLTLWTESEFSSILAVEDSWSALDWMNSKKVVYVCLNTLAFEEASRRFGRLILQDIKSAVQRLQGINLSQRPTTSVIIDEFASVASSGFIELLNKARSANVRLTLAHQSQGDLTAISPSFADQILDNTNAKIIFRLDSPDTSDFYSRLIGTRTSQKQTLQFTGGGFLGSSNTGMGTTRDTEEFIVSPNQLRRLGRGEAVILTKIPAATHKCKLRPIQKWIFEIDKSKTQRRFKWPTFQKIV